MAQDGNVDLTDSVVVRMGRERAKALAKYGEDALLPGGNPAYDILDYTINEVVGLHRYADMIVARVNAHPEWRDGDRLGLLSIAYSMRAFSGDIGTRLIGHRTRLLDDGFSLGTPEDRS